ncbi:MAG TPA: heme exporter protein CcmD [Alphaproteobacteria bacterium]|nr:heme exporter protein CcmD [Alphaproteobacteria bacterium]
MSGCCLCGCGAKFWRGASGRSSWRAPAACKWGRPADMAEFFAMGGFAAFVWPAWLTVIVLMAGIAVASLRGLRQAQATLDALESEAERT